jgi:hypothetical protein
MRSLAACVVLIIAAPAMAQTAPKAVKTMRVEATHAPLYTIDAAGTVTIDWGRVEAAARSVSLTDHDIARALIAVRDGTTRPER